MPMLKNSNIVPPIGYIFLCPFCKEHEFFIKGNTYNQLVRNTEDHFFVNSTTHKAPSSFDVMIQDFLCSQLDEGWCTGEGKTVRRFTLRQMESVTRAFKDRLDRGVARLVDDKEVDRRAAICIPCPKNENFWGCWSCIVESVAIAALTKGLASKYDGYLKACGVCGCVLKSMIHIDAEGICACTKVETFGDYPAYCWKRKILEGAFNERNKKAG